MEIDHEHFRMGVDPLMTLARGIDFAYSMQAEAKSRLNITASELMLGYICVQLQNLEDNTWENIDSVEKLMHGAFLDNLRESLEIDKMIEVLNMIKENTKSESFNENEQ